MLEMWTIKELEILIKIIFYTLQNSLYDLFNIFSLFDFHYVTYGENLRFSTISNSPIRIMFYLSRLWRQVKYTWHIRNKFSSYKKKVTDSVYHYVCRLPTVCLHCVGSIATRKRFGATANRSFSLGNFYRHTCIRNNGIKPRGAMPLLCGKFTIKLAKSPTTSRPSARPAYETQMVIVNRKSVFFSLPPNRMRKVSEFIHIMSLPRRKQRTSFSLEGLPYSPGRSLVFCTRVKHPPPRNRYRLHTAGVVYLRPYLVPIFASEFGIIRII